MYIKLSKPMSATYLKPMLFIKAHLHMLFMHVENSRIFQASQANLMLESRYNFNAMG